MSSNNHFEFNINTERNCISIKRLFEAQLPKVWNAFTNKDVLDQWWAPRPWKTRTKSMDFSEGGKWLYAMVGPNAEEHWAIAVFSNIVPLKSYAGLDAFTDSEGNINNQMPQSKWQVSFHAQVHSTLVVLKLPTQTQPILKKQ